MSAECCGSEDLTPATPANPSSRVEQPGVADDACCGVSRAATDPPPVRPPWWRDRALLPSTVSGILLATGYGLGWNDLPIPALVAQSMALAAGAWTFVPGTVRRLLHRRVGVGLLMTIAAIGAVLLGHVGEAAALAFLFSLAETLEDRAMDRAKEGLRALLSLVPQTARVSRLAGEETVPVTQVRELDILVIGAGERIATDGVVVEGRSTLDTSAVTGESIPVAVAPGDAVSAGAVNGAGSVLIEATADGTDNSLTQIVALVEQAHARKGERARLADRIAKPLVPAVLIVAALVGVFGLVIGDPLTWTERALVVLVAASPCALAIAVPVTVISAIGSASRFGMVIKSGQAFEQLGAVRTVVFDKTGTLTRNHPEVVEVVAASGASQAQVLDDAAALEATSSHPLAAAITAAANDRVPQAARVTEDAGAGITGIVGERRVRIGSTRWVSPGALHHAADDLAGRGMTVVVVESDGDVTGLIGVRDELRAEAAEVVRLLNGAGIETVMLTGDNPHTAHALAAEAGITQVRAEQSPSDKAHVVNLLSAQGTTAMVGDGINDAPALATASVGIAMGATGTAAAIESADVAFTGHDLRLLPDALAHARRGRRIMTWNIAFSLTIIAVLTPLALFGVLGLAGVVLVHEIAEVLVILNGVRAARRPGVPTTTSAPARPGTEMAAATARERPSPSAETESSAH